MRRCFFVFIALSVTLTHGAAAKEYDLSRGAGPVAGEVNVEPYDMGGGSYAIEGRFTVEASTEAIWNVLTDYDHISRFVPSMRLSRVLERSDDHILLKQQSIGKAFFIPKELRVLLVVHEEPFQRIFFQDISHEDFELYVGSWHIESKPENFEISYALRIKYTSSLPKFLVKKSFKKNADRLLNELRDEILRRPAPKPLP